MTAVRCIAFSSNRGPGTGGYEYDVVAMPSGGGSVTNLTNASTSADVTPAWSPDGRQIAYVLQRTPPQQVLPIYATNADGTNKHALTGNSFHAFPAWSPDGTQVAYTGVASGASQIFVMDADGNHQHNISNGGDALDPPGRRTAAASSTPRPRRRTDSGTSAS